MTVTEPSSEFSIGTIAHSTRPARSAVDALVDARQRHRHDAARAAQASSASSLKVPSGPR